MPDETAISVYVKALASKIAILTCVFLIFRRWHLRVMRKHIRLNQNLFIFYSYPFLDQMVRSRIARIKRLKWFNLIVVDQNLYALDSWLR